jgi:hypothetical protein
VMALAIPAVGAQGAPGDAAGPGKTGKVFAAEEYFPARKGDRFEYVSNRGGEKKVMSVEVVEVKRDGKAARVSMKAESTLNKMKLLYGMTVTLSDTELILERKLLNPEFKKMKPHRLKLLDLPLNSGKTWTYKKETRYTVEKYQARLRVPAGQFEDCAVIKTGPIKGPAVSEVALCKGKGLIVIDDGTARFERSK